jgi:Flp pilus assembly protein CpaB
MGKKGTSRFLLVIGLAVVAFVLTALFLSSLNKQVPVVVSTTYLEAGSVLTADVLEVKNVHPAALLPNAAQDPAALVGKILQVQRVAGDQVTADMVGDTGGSAIAAGLAPDHRAIAVDVTRATGVLGVLRAGDLVDVVATVDSGGVGAGSSVTAVVVRGARVLVVPQAFRYQEAPVTADNPAGVLPAGQTDSRQSEQNTVVLDVPLAPLAITAGYTDTLTGQFVPPQELSPVELLAMLNAKATLHLVLRPPDAQDIAVAPLDLAALLETLVPPAEKP